MHARAGRWAAVAALAVLGLVMSGCGDNAAPTGGSAAEPSSGSTAPSDPTPPAPSTKDTATVGTQTALAPTAYPESQQEYTSSVVRAWGVGDRGNAGWLATKAAVEELFGTTDRGGPGWSLVGCDNAGPWPACTFSDRGQGQRLVLFYDADKLGQPRAVRDVEFISDNPTLATQ